MLVVQRLVENLGEGLGLKESMVLGLMFLYVVREESTRMIQKELVSKMDRSGWVVAGEGMR